MVAVLLLLAGSVHGYEDKTIAQWLSDNGFVTLVSVLKTANLYSVLDSPGKNDFVILKSEAKNHIIL